MKSDQGDTIQEMKETPSPVQCQSKSIHDSQVGDTYISSESFSSLELRNSSGYVSGFKKRFGGIASASTRFSDV